MTLCPFRLLQGTTAALLVLAGTAMAADPPTPVVDRFTPARAQIAQKNWPAALVELKRINDPASADWHNLMGYSLRKNQPPDYVGAERHYDEALRLNPQHRGALEYSGELYLLTNRPALAEARLAALDKACLLPCDEYTDLKQAIARYKSQAPAQR